MNSESSASGKEIAALGLLVVLVAAATGAASAFFLWSLDLITGWRWAHPGLVGLLPVIGVGLVLGYQRWGRGTERGSLWVVEELRGGNRPVPFRLAPAVWLATMLTHLGGGSAGREGTAVQMGAGIAAGMARFVRKPSPFVRRSLLLAGVSAGFGSVFGTPFAGAVFALEVQLARSFLDLQGSRAAGASSVLRWFPLVLVAAWIGHGVCWASGAHHTPYPAPHRPDWLRQMLVVVAVGLASGLAARAYVLLGEEISRACVRWVPLPWCRPVVGALILLGTTYVLRTDAYLGLGVTHPEPTTPSLIHSFESGGVSPWSWWWKLVFTAVTLSTGFKGGEVTPLLFVGAALGNAVAGVLGLPVGLSASVGCVAVFAAASRTPLACAIMGMELFGVAPGPALLLGCGLAFLASGSRGIYSTR